MKLFVFVNGSFVNNKDFSSQIRYLIILSNKTANEAANETKNRTDEFTIKGNLIHYSSTKSKRVTRSVCYNSGNDAPSHEASRRMTMSFLAVLL